MENKTRSGCEFSFCVHLQPHVATVVCVRLLQNCPEQVSTISKRKYVRISYIILRMCLWRQKQSINAHTHTHIRSIQFIIFSPVSLAFFVAIHLPESSSNACTSFFSLSTLLLVLLLFEKNWEINRKWCYAGISNRLYVCIQFIPLQQKWGKKTWRNTIRRQPSIVVCGRVTGWLWTWFFNGFRRIVRSVTNRLYRQTDASSLIHSIRKRSYFVFVSSSLEFIQVDFV